MKKHIWLQFIILLLVPGCELINFTEPDYREDFTGNYSFSIRHNYTSGAIDEPIRIDTTYTYIGSISIIDSTDEQILVDWGNDTIYSNGDIYWTKRSNFTIDSSGIISWPEYGDYYKTKFLGGNINNDSIKFIIRWGSIELWGEYQVNGIKVE